MFNSYIMHHDQVILLHIIDKIKLHNWNHKQVAMHDFQFDPEAMIARYMAAESAHMYPVTTMSSEQQVLHLAKGAVPMKS